MTQQPSRRLSEQQKLEVLNRDIILRLNEKLNKGLNQRCAEIVERNNSMQTQPEPRRLSLQLHHMHQRPFSPSRQRLHHRAAERKASYTQPPCSPQPLRQEKMTAHVEQEKDNDDGTKN
uniref:Uncharacterized protein n=1 Tax=Plectus sambesii TaxID=2011161 RepID=A0A914VL51_9BILA